MPMLPIVMLVRFMEWFYYTYIMLAPAPVMQWWNDTFMTQMF